MPPFQNACALIAPFCFTVFFFFELVKGAHERRGAISKGASSKSRDIESWNV
jgi:hypothetical protein